MQRGRVQPAVKLEHPGSSNKNYAVDYPYVRVIAGDFTQKGAPHVGDWAAILSDQVSVYSTYVLSGAAAVPYSDPAGTGGYTGSGVGTIGYDAPWQICTSQNVPLPALRAITQRSCFLQTFQSQDGRCLTYPTEPNHPTMVIFDGFYNSQGQYCPANYGGQIDATICADGSVWNGFVSCEGR